MKADKKLHREADHTHGNIASSVNCAWLNKAETLLEMG
jgi:hypothetical protein